MARRVYDYSSNGGDLMHTGPRMNRAHAICDATLHIRVLAIQQRKVHCVTW